MALVVQRPVGDSPGTGGGDAGQEQVGDSTSTGTFAFQ